MLRHSDTADLGNPASPECNHLASESGVRRFSAWYSLILRRKISKVAASRLLVCSQIVPSNLETGNPFGAFVEFRGGAHHMLPDMKRSSRSQILQWEVESPSHCRISPTLDLSYTRAHKRNHRCDKGLHFAIAV
jgi:hypothetical protein